MMSSRNNIFAPLKAVVAAILLLLPLSAAFSQERDSSITAAQNIIRGIGMATPVPEIIYVPVAPPKYWTTGTYMTLGFSQVSLTNWAAGGSGSIALNGYVNAMRNYAKDNLYWDNRLQLAYGFVQSFDQGYRKSDDKFIIDSKAGYSAFKNFFFSAAFNLKSQLTPGFTYNSAGDATKVSKLFSPGYMTFAIGIDYKPKGKWYSATISPVALNSVFVLEKDLRTKYGNKENEAVKVQVGAMFTGKIDYKFNSFKASSELTLFSDYKHNPQNMVVNWDVLLAYQLNKFLEITVRTNLIYDDKILISDKDGNMAPRVQFQESLGISFAYTIGEFKK